MLKCWDLIKLIIFTASSRILLSKVGFFKKQKTRVCGSECNDYKYGLLPLSWLRPRYQEFYSPLLWCRQHECRHRKKATWCLNIIMKTVLTLWTSWKDLSDLQWSLHNTLKLLLRTIVSFSIVSYRVSSKNLLHIFRYPIANNARCIVNIF